MISPFVPFPPNSGGKVRVYNILKHLRRYHHVTFVAPYFMDSSDLQHEDDRLLRLTAPSGFQSIHPLFSRLPHHAARIKDGRVNDWIKQLIDTSHYDLIYLHYLYSLEYLPNSIQIPIVLDPQNVDRSLWFRKAQNRANSLPYRLYAWINALKTRQYEMQHLKKLRAYVSASESDRADTRTYACPPVMDFLMAPNGVQTTLFPPKPASVIVARKVTLGFVGSMDLSINQHGARELCLDVLPIVREKLPGWQIDVLIVGKNPPQSIINLGVVDSKIKITGTVPEIVKYLHQMDIMVLPLREGGGTKLRVLEGMSAGLPIIGTNLAFMGIDGLEDGHHCCYAETKEGMVEAIINLAQNASKRKKIGVNARKLILQRYDWGKIAEDLSQQLDLIVSPN